MMTVGELITRLSTYPRDWEVEYSDFEQGYTEITRIDVKLERICPPNEPAYIKKFVLLAG